MEGEEMQMREEQDDRVGSVGGIQREDMNGSVSIYANWVGARGETKWERARYTEEGR